jgi:predicted membrane-bound mannosyltransferase
MPPGTMDTQQSATASRTAGSSTDTPAPIAIATATDHDRRHAEAVLGTRGGRPRSPCWASHDTRTMSGNSAGPQCATC